MPAPIGIQLYTVREHLARDFDGVVEQLAEIGYLGVEPAGFPGTTPEKAGQLFQKLGLKVPSAHMPLPLGEKAPGVFEAMTAIGAQRIISGLGEADFKTPEAIQAAARKFNAAAEAAEAHGFRFGIHNHWAEFEKVGNRRAYEILLEHLSPTVFFEIDTYWVQTAGADPAAVVAELKHRAPLLHIKDGPCQKGVPMTPVGQGKVDFHKIVQAGGEAIEWMIVELDEAEIDMLEAVKKSYTYLVQEGLARGRRN